MLFKNPYCATKQRMMEKKLKFLRDILGLRGYCKHVNMQTWGGGVIAISGMQTTDNVALVNLRVWQTKSSSTKV